MFHYNSPLIQQRITNTHTYWFVSGQTRTGPKKQPQRKYVLEQCQKSPEASSIVHEACVINDALIFFPICSMYGIFTYIWVFFGANVGKYSIHGAYGFLRGSKFGHLICHGNLFSKIPFFGDTSPRKCRTCYEFRPCDPGLQSVENHWHGQVNGFPAPKLGEKLTKNPTYLDSYLGHNRKSVLNS